MVNCYLHRLPTINLNKVFLLGRLAADPEVRTTASGQTVVNIRLATNRIWNDKNSGERKEQTEFHTIVAWSKLAEIVQKYLSKGQLAFFEGRLQTRSWQGADGVKRYRTEIVAENLQLGPRTGALATTPQKTADATRVQTNLPPSEEIPIIDEEAPVTSPIISDSDLEESEINLKEIPF